MSKSNKLLERLLLRPKDFTFKELEKLLFSFGFILSNVGRTSGSAVRFINHLNKHIIRIHKPHPHPELKAYVINFVINELKKGGYINDK
ncbi:MAG: type II toxin-antitoxin system HicA family toxin [Oscillospiraceae bacterium]|nr:type II toxin-antitoxin system HicA family toxin [Oscillospiraceae bacterium]